MYLSKILLENQGPIKKFEINLNNPGQPLILVGSNGTGKTILLSYIADALYEFGKQAYTDLLGKDGDNNKFFRYSGAINRKHNENYSIAYLKFNDSNEYEYFETTGNFNLNAFKEQYPNLDIKLNLSDTNENIKTTTDNMDDFRKIFRSNAIGYFMPNRFEKPHWLNTSAKDISHIFNLNLNLFNELEKPIILEETLEINKQWILGVYLDSLVDIERVNNTFSFSKNQNINNKQAFKQTRDNVQKVIQEIVGNPNAILAVNDRYDRNSRICIKDKFSNEIIIPSLDHFSTGQAVLFNLFCSIIRYADIGDVNNSISLDRIKGIAIIDEIDLHLHTDLQYKVLPKLMKLFPNVQFIISTHSPLFVLGMEREYSGNTNKPIIIEMPKDTPITAERFSEFINAYDCLTKTKRFEDSIVAEIEKQTKNLQNSTKKAVLYVEGKTDITHIENAWNNLYNNTEIPFDIFTLNGADNIKQFLISYSKEQINKKVIGIVDYDEKGMDVIKGLNKNFDNISNNLYKRKNENGNEKDAYIITLPTPSEEFAKYEYCPIEFLYEKSLLEQYSMIAKRNINKLNLIYSKVNNDYINREQLKQKDDLWFYEITESNMSKNDFANEIKANNQLKKDDFRHFEPLFEIINNIIKDSNDLQDEIVEETT